MSKLLDRRIREAWSWIMEDGERPHWRTQKMLFGLGYIDFSPTGWALTTDKMHAYLAKHKAAPAPSPQQGGQKDDDGQH